jgi:hypothetical protein
MQLSRFRFRTVFHRAIVVTVDEIFLFKPVVTAHAMQFYL